MRQGGPLLQSSPGRLGVGLGDVGLFSLETGPGHVSGFHESVGPVAISRLAVGIDGNGFGIPEIGVGIVLEPVVHVPGVECWAVPGGIGGRRGKVRLERCGQVFVVEGSLGLLEQRLRLGGAVVGISNGERENSHRASDGHAHGGLGDRAHRGLDVRAVVAKGLCAL
jgi:hypothetical protein